MYSQKVKQIKDAIDKACYSMSYAVIQNMDSGVYVVIHSLCSSDIKTIVESDPQCQAGLFTKVPHSIIDSASFQESRFEYWFQSFFGISASECQSASFNGITHKEIENLKTSLQNNTVSVYKVAEPALLELKQSPQLEQVPLKPMSSLPQSGKGKWVKFTVYMENEKENSITVPGIHYLIKAPDGRVLSKGCTDVNGEAAYETNEDIEQAKLVFYRKDISVQKK